MDQLLLEMEHRKKQALIANVQYFMDIINERHKHDEVDIIKVETHNPGTSSQYDTYHVHMKAERTRNR